MDLDLPSEKPKSRDTRNKKWPREEIGSTALNGTSWKCKLRHETLQLRVSLRLLGHAVPPQLGFCKFRIVLVCCDMPQPWHGLQAFHDHAQLTRVCVAGKSTLSLTTVGGRADTLYHSNLGSFWCSFAESIVPHRMLLNRGRMRSTRRKDNLSDCNLVFVFGATSPNDQSRHTKWQRPGEQSKRGSSYLWPITKVHSSTRKI